MSVIFRISSDVLKDERASRGYDQDLKHEIIERLEEDRAEGLRLESIPVIIAEKLRSILE